MSRCDKPAGQPDHDDGGLFPCRLGRRVGPQPQQAGQTQIHQTGQPICMNPRRLRGPQHGVKRPDADELMVSS